MTWLHWLFNFGYAMRGLFIDYLPGIVLGAVVGFLGGMAFGARMERRNRPRLFGRWNERGYYPEK